jgi:hypothetical protein
MEEGWYGAMGILFNDSGYLQHKSRLLKVIYMDFVQLYANGMPCKACLRGDCLKIVLASSGR